MKNFKLLLFLAAVLCSTACNTIVSKKVMDEKQFTFQHAGKTISVPVELQEIRTSRRQGFLIGNREVTFDYAMVVKGNGEDFILDPCEQNASIDAYISKIKIKRSKDRTHFALGVDDRTIVIFHSFKQHRFVGYAPLFYPEEVHDFRSLNLDALPSARKVLMDHVTGDKIVEKLDKNTLVDILCELPPQDELNQEAIYMLTDNRANQLGSYNEERLIKHCKKSDLWKRKAVIALKDRKEFQDLKSYTEKLYFLAGKYEVEKEDWKALRTFDKNPDIAYFKMRMAMSEPAINPEITKQFKLKLEKTLMNVCALSNANRENFITNLQLLEDFGDKNVFERFLSNYEKSSCKAESLHALNNSFLYSGNLRTKDKRLWIDFVAQNFKSIPAKERAWDYDRIKDDLSCKDKRAILLKFKKDIDTFGDMEIPVCN